MLSINERRAWFNLIEKIRMIADLLELHQHIKKLDFVAYAINHINISCKNILIELFLHF
jgi:hypothetical protein